LKKVLVIVPFPMSEENLALRREQLKAVSISDSISFIYRPVKAAPRNYISQADMVLADMGILEAGINAEQEGLSAVCIDTMSDSGVAALRSILSIPVIGPGRTSMLFALSLGTKFSIITMWEKWRHLYDKTVKDLGIGHALASVRSINMAPDNQALLNGKEEALFPLLEQAAKKAIEEDGAEVILLGSTTMHQAHDYLSKALDVPVINPGPMTYKMAEMMVSSSLSHSRKAYPISPVSRHDMIVAMMESAARFDN